MSDATTPTRPDEPKKRPASQYYWGDWWKDKGLHSCSLAARGLWHEMNCLMHEGEPYGHLTLNAKPMTVQQLANQCRISAGQCAKLLAELEAAGVFSKTPEGVIFSRRMVRDEGIRNARASGGKDGAEHGIKGAEHGSKGGRPKVVEGGFGTPLGVGRKPPPSSSSSSSSSSKEREGAPSTAEARPHEDDPPEANGHSPTPAGAVCRAMRQAGLTSVNPGDPRLLALLDQGATEAEFVGIAAEAVAKSKGWAWVLTVLQARRAEAAAIDLAPPPTADPLAWAKTRDGVINRANALGLAAFDEVAAHVGTGPTWAAYRKSVIDADDRIRQGATA